MDRDLIRNWMWSQACEMLARAKRLHREFFRPIRSASRLAAGSRPSISWKPSARFSCLSCQVSAPIVSKWQSTGGELVVADIRVLPAELQTAVIHRLKLPQGRFERRVHLPAGAYTSIRRSAVDGCLLIALQRGGEFGD
jgi:HSP20 family protein